MAESEAGTVGAGCPAPPLAISPILARPFCAPEMDRFLKEHLFADVFERDVLSYKQRELVTISVIASLGALEPMLGSHYNLSLNVGWQPKQLESFTQIIGATAGKEKAKSALSVLSQILENRE